VTASPFAITLHCEIIFRGHPADVVSYSALKKQLADQFAHDIDGYVAGKTDFILSILAQYGFPADNLESIRRANPPRAR
jgi:hypothetical protein